MRSIRDPAGDPRLVHEGTNPTGREVGNLMSTQYGTPRRPTSFRLKRSDVESLSCAQSNGNPGRRVTGPARPVYRRAGGRRVDPSRPQTDWSGAAGDHAGSPLWTYRFPKGRPVGVPWAAPGTGPAIPDPIPQYPPDLKRAFARGGVESARSAFLATTHISRQRSSVVVRLWFAIDGGFAAAVDGV